MSTSIHGRARPLSPKMAATHRRVVARFDTFPEGTARMTIVRAERGHHLPRAGILQRLAATLGVSTDWLLTGRDDQA